MPRLHNRIKKVACLEGEWSGWRDKTTVVPILQLVESQIPGFDYFHRRLSSEQEFVSSLEKVRRFASYSLVYFAFHGEPGMIETDLFQWSLSDLADQIGRTCAQKVIHFGSCSTLRVDEEQILDFLERTGVAMITGYTEDVEWIESAAFELLYLHLWQYFINTGSFINRIRADYGDLVERLGFVAFSNG